MEAESKSERRVRIKYYPNASRTMPELPSDESSDDDFAIELKEECDSDNSELIKLPKPKKNSSKEAKTKINEKCAKKEAPKRSSTTISKNGL
ncbi:hypothetical protein MXB_3245, partial [Myxobolus squamalis]